MKRLLLLAALLAAIPAPASAQARGWNCELFERDDPGRPAHMFAIVGADGSRGPIGFTISWARPPDPVAEQRYIWRGIAPDAAILAPPDEIELGIRAPRVDPRGWIVFTSPGAEPVNLLAAGATRWLPSYRTAWVSAARDLQVAPLWAGRDWTAELFNRYGRSFGRQPLLLPDREAAQAVFIRMKTALDRMLADPPSHCRAVSIGTRTERQEPAI